ncbi:MAG: ABC transporter ATP-binding protein/permease [Psittacicella sp.]
MNLVHSIMPSIIWTLWVSAASFIGAALFLFLIVKFTKFGKTFWLLSKDFVSFRKNKAGILIYLVAILFTTLGVRVMVLFTYWQDGFWGAMQDYNVSKAWLYMGIFFILAAVYTIQTFVIMYSIQGFTILWRKQLNAKMLKDYTDNKSYYKADYTGLLLENPDQRIQQDITDFTTVSSNLLLNFLSNTVSAITFTIVLYTMAGPLKVFGVTIPHAMLWGTYLYFMVTAVLAFKIGKPFIKLTFLQQKFNATYRHSLIDIRENKESIAFQNGEQAERESLDKNFANVLNIAWKTVYRTVFFQGYNFIWNQASVLFPVVILLPFYFASKSSAVTIGVIFAVSTAFSNLYGNLFWFQSVYGNPSQIGKSVTVSYGSFASYLAILQRLQGFYDVINRVKDVPSPDIEYDNKFKIVSLKTFTPSGENLLSDLNLDLGVNEKLIIMGPSGVGKTTLLRSLAGLWPFSEGGIILPKNSSFLPQTPYVPDGTLLESLYYPNPAPRDGTRFLEEGILRKVHLPHLIPYLYHEKDNTTWMDGLSKGERQRAAFARILLKRPKVIFLDEATASLDESLEESLYTLLLEELPGTRVISIAHRSTLLKFHSKILEINQDKSWTLKDITKVPVE